MAAPPGFFGTEVRASGRFQGGSSLPPINLSSPSFAPGTSGTWETRFSIGFDPAASLPQMDAFEATARDASSGATRESVLVPLGFIFGAPLEVPIADPIIKPIEVGLTGGAEIAWGQPIFYDVVYDAGMIPDFGMRLFPRFGADRPSSPSGPGAGLILPGTELQRERLFFEFPRLQSPTTRVTALGAEIRFENGSASRSVLAPVDVLVRDAVVASAAVPLPAAGLMLPLALAALAFRGRTAARRA
ncbi:MAG: hypothetical protein AAFU61_03650 [Pseudomonadota bacterium]